MDMGSLSSYLPMLQQMMSQNRPPVATPGINPMATQQPQPLPSGVPFGMMPQISQQMGQRNPTPLFRSPTQSAGAAPQTNPTTQPTSTRYPWLTSGYTGNFGDGSYLEYWKNRFGIGQ